MRKTIVFSLILFLLFTKTNNVFAAFDFTSTETSITDTQELIVHVTLDLSSSTANSKYYLRGAFYKEGTSNYFGYTINNTDTAYNGPYSDCKNLYEITVDADGNGSADIKVKPDPEDSAFKGSGDYLFKVGRYTESCNITWADSDPIKMSITQTAFPSPTPSPTPKSTPSPSPSTASTTAKAASPKVTPKPSSSPQTPKQASESAAVLGEKDTTSSSPIDSFSASPAPSASYQSPVSQKVAAMLIGSGAILIGLSFASFVWYKRSQDKLKINKNQDRFEENKIEEQ